MDKESEEELRARLVTLFGRSRLRHGLIVTGGDLWIGDTKEGLGNLEGGIDLDHLPPGCAMEALVDLPSKRVRFRATRPTRGLRRLWRKHEVSQWSGWFSADEKVGLNWDAFDFGKSG